MTPHSLDDVDRGILHVLQRDARNHSASSIAEEVGVSPNTVRNRIDTLESQGVILGYGPHVNFEQAGYQLHVIFIGTVPVSEREGSAREAVGVEGVIEVVEILSGHENLAIEAVGTDSDDLTATATSLEDLGIEIRDEWFVKRVRTRPFDDFARERATE